MSSRTHATIRKNVYFIGENDDLMETVDYEEWDSFGGWMVDRDNTKDGELYANKFTKEGLEVFVVNTHEYSRVGEQWWVVYGENRAAVEQFCEDAGFEMDRDNPIYDQEVVSQTL